MYCDHCGTQLGPQQNFCRACGKPLAGIPTGPARSRLDGHLRLLGILWLAISAFRLLPSMFLLGFGRMGIHLPMVPHFVLPILGLVGGFLLLGSIFGFVAGWGLLEHQPWARPLSIALGVLALFDPPLGTALGIYTLWVLMSNGGEQEYERLSRA